MLIVLGESDRDAQGEVKRGFTAVLCAAVLAAIGSQQVEEEPDGDKRNDKHKDKIIAAEEKARQ